MADIREVTTSLADALPALIPFAPAAAYLGCVWLILLGFARVPVWVHALALAAGLCFRLAFTDTPLVQVLWPLAVVAGVFVTLVAVAARTVSGVSLFSICVGLALTPVDGWPGLVLGLSAAAVVAGTRTWRSMGKGRVWFLTSDTLSGLGISTAGGFKPPEPHLIPTRETLMSDDDTSAQKVMYLPPYLLAGVVAAAVMAVVQAG